MDALTTIIAAVAAFIATNIDDIFILMLFFAQATTLAQKWRIVIGQYLGLSILVAFSALGAFSTLVVPEAWIGLLGLVPIALGIQKLIRPERKTLEAHSETRHLLQPTSKGRRALLIASLLSPEIYTVAAVRVGNGGDDLSVYIPLFASGGLARMGLIVGVFFVFIGIWCYMAYRLERTPVVARVLNRFGFVIVPFFLIALGLFILIDSGTLPINFFFTAARLWP